MSNMSCLDSQYISKRKFLRKPCCLLSFRDGQSSLKPASYQPNENEMKQVFNIFDADRDGKISQQDYEAMLKALRKDDLIESVPKFFEKVDSKKDGFIDFKEFMDTQKKGGGVTSLDIKIAFRFFDLNGDNKITADEVQEVLRRLGQGYSLEDCQRMVRAVDSDGDGMVNMGDFITMMTRSMKHV